MRYGILLCLALGASAACTSSTTVYVTPAPASTDAGSDALTVTPPTSQDASVDAPAADDDASARDAASDAAPAFADDRFSGYHAGSNTPTTIALRDYQDPTRATRDLVIVVVSAPWSAADRAMMQSLSSTPVPRAAVITLIGDGPTPNTPATAANLAAWHSAYPNIEAAMDPGLVRIEPALGAITAVPHTFAFDAGTLKRVGDSEGFGPRSVFDAEVDGWRALAK